MALRDKGVFLAPLSLFLVNANQMPLRRLAELIVVYVVYFELILR